MQPFDHASVSSAAEAITRLGSAAAGVRVIAGGTDLLPLMKDGLAAPRALLDIKPARDLRSLRFDDGALRIGALTTLAEIERSAELAEKLPILVQSVADAATPQLRAMATVGGNLLQRNRCWYFRGPFDCWLKGGQECFARGGENKYHAIYQQSPCVAVHPSDLAPALVALDAEVEIVGPSGKRTVTVADLLAPPADDARVEHRLRADELLVAVRVPAASIQGRGAYLKMMDRQAWAFALVSAAAQLSLREGRVERARLVLGAVANVPWRVREAERLLEGQRFTPDLAARAAERAVEGATPLAHNGYKVPLARELARRALLAAAGSEP